MGATRKLQGEIDRVLKKVQEGVDVFDSIWNKVYDTENANQKEKFEADLKKEIKKLQRYRDQIKTWIQSSEIKDKKALLDARKLIEREMERFKVCEKETKTKAFSKEGLGQQPKTDPREKAKGESRDWLNNMVSELESQIDSFEAEMEGLQVKKGKSRPPRLTHLDESIVRHKKHIGKLELILRLLDNDELSPDQVTDVKDLVEDYVERNQESFDEFEDVEEVYESLPLDKIEDPSALDAINIVIPPVSMKDKPTSLTPGIVSPDGSKSTQGSPGAQQPVAAGVIPMASLQTPPAVHLPDEVSVPDDSGIRTPPALVVRPVTSPPVISLSSAVMGSAGTGSSPSTPTRVPSSVLLPNSGPARVPIKQASTPISPSPVAPRAKPEERKTSVDQRLSLGAGEMAPGRVAIGSRGATPASLASGPTATLAPASLSAAPNATVMSSNSLATVPLVSDPGKRSVEDRFAAPPVPSLVAQSRTFVQPGPKVLDPSAAGDGVSIGDGGMLGNRMNYPNSTWRQHTVNPFQNQTEAGVFRTKIAPDQKQEYVQRFHHVNQQGPNASLAQQISQFSGGGQNKQQNLLQLQLLQQGNSLVQAVQAASLQQQQAGLQPSQSSSGSVPQVTQKQMGAQQVMTTPVQQLQQQLSFGSSVTVKDSGVTEQQSQQHQGQLQELGDDGNNDSATLGPAFARSVSLSDEDLKNSDTFNVSISGPGTLAELSQLSRDVDFTPGQPVQSAQLSGVGHGIIGRRMTELGAIGDNLTSSTAAHDQLFNLQMLEAAYRNIPQPKDSERPKHYIPRNRANTPSSYPQTPAPILDNPALWERLDTDVLFFAFYYQQGTYHQYLAARELKKQSWRYHKKYNTWFQRHEEPKVTTDEYEQGTYVYFDFNVLHGESSQGWCQRIKTEFTFEYSYLEDELYVP